MTDLFTTTQTSASALGCCDAGEIAINHTPPDRRSEAYALTDRRREVRAEIQSRVGGARGDRSSDVRDELEHADASTQGDIELALVQMGLQTVARIDDALMRLDAGKYGSCLECAREISELRLRALPFAVRCQACEEPSEKYRGRKEAWDEKRHSISRCSR